jgi:flagellar protein FliS
MFGAPQRGAVAYANVGMETGVMSASPHKLVVMLFEGAMLHVTLAKQHMGAKRTALKGKEISRAISFIENGLRASLNKNVGGELALNLDALYAYMSKRLIAANTKNDVEILDEVHRLLGELKGAWDAINPENSAQAQQSAPIPPVASDPLAPRNSRLMKA